MLHRRLLHALLMSIMALMAATPALAAKPIIQEFYHEDSYVSEDLCGFPILFNPVVRGRVITHVDKEGNPTKVIIHVHYEGTLTNLETGKTFRDPTHLTIIEDVEAGTTSVAGLGYNVIAPGRGNAVRQIGRVVFDAQGNVIFQAGHNDLLEEGFEATCPVLAG